MKVKIGVTILYANIMVKHEMIIYRFRYFFKDLFKDFKKCFCAYQIRKAFLFIKIDILFIISHIYVD